VPQSHRHSGVVSVKKQWWELTAILSAMWQASCHLYLLQEAFKGGSKRPLLLFSFFFFFFFFFDN